MTFPISVPATRPPHIPRQRDRRGGLGGLLAATVRHIERGGDAALMRGAFESALRRALPVRSVRLRDAGSRWSTGGARTGSETIALDVRGSDPAIPGVLEASFDPECRMGEWDFQFLGVAAHIGALILEIDRCRIQLVRAGLLPAGKPKRDGAAPLIGSAPAMAALRSTIERVATTDFTVLLEGESGVGKSCIIKRYCEEQELIRSISALTRTIMTIHLNHHHDHHHHHHHYHHDHHHHIITPIIWMVMMLCRVAVCDEVCADHRSRLRCEACGRRWVGGGLG